jgi:hypothetical protein
VGEHIQYACPGGCARALHRVQEDGSPSDRPALGQSVTSVSTPLTDKTIHQSLVTSPPVAQHRSNLVWPNGRAYDPNHYGMGIMTRSQLSHSDRILCPRSDPRKSGQQSRYLGSREPVRNACPLHIVTS